MAAPAGIDPKNVDPRDYREAARAGTVSLAALRAAARHCRACDLWRNATQTVFGEGPVHAALMLVGEQPGDHEDRQGHPFVGPAGRLLDRALTAAGVQRSDVYLTNAVKHFRWELRGKWRIHKKPRPHQVRACRPWLEAEIFAVEPRVIVCLGATAAQALLGRDFRVTERRGEPVPSTLARCVIATVHPSSILRAPDDAVRRSETDRFIADLRVAVEHAGEIRPRTPAKRSASG
ncbi:MAG: UdgX family uracil-DNA binding protein [Candidatus Binatia bacterium]